MEQYVYTVEDIVRILKIGKNSAYSLLKDPPFTVLRIKHKIRIPKEPFHNWLNNTNIK